MACTDDVGSESNTESSTDEVGTSESGQSTESSSDDSTSAESSESSAGESSDSTGAESSATTESTTDASGTTTDTGSETGVLEPTACPLVEPDEFDVSLQGALYDFLTESETPISSLDCSLPAAAMLSPSDAYGPEYIAFGTNGCEDGVDIWLDGEFMLPNNNWAPITALEFGSCYEFRFFTEPAEPEGCRLARLDVYDPANLEVPVYSLGSTNEQLDVGGFVVEPIDPILCESECTSGEVRSLRFGAGAGEVEIAPDTFPWAVLDTGTHELQVIRYDAFSLTPSADPNCPGGAPLARTAWAAKRP
jgi:hypothetical protein